MKGIRLSFLLPRCSLSYLKIVQTEGNAKFAKIRIANLKPIYFIFITEVPPILSKDRLKNIYYCFTCLQAICRIYEDRNIVLTKVNDTILLCNTNKMI